MSEPPETPESRICRQAREQYQRYAEQGQRAVKAVCDYCRSKYERYGNWDNVKKIIEVVGVIGLIAYVIINHGLLVATQQQLDLARSEFEATQRPWIFAQTAQIGDAGLELNPAGMKKSAGFVYGFDGAWIELVFTLINEGHSPAKRVAILPAIYARDVSTPEKNAVDMQRGWAKTKCDETRSGETVVGGITLFPNAPESEKVWMRMPTAEVMRLIGTPMTTIMVTGCVDYQYEFGAGHHQTQFLYEVDKAGPNGTFLKIDPAEGDLPVSSVVLAVNPVLDDSAD